MSFELVEKIEVGSGGVSQIEFTGIPQDADELVVFFSLRGVTATNAYGSFMYFNGETSSANVDYRIVTTYLAFKEAQITMTLLALAFLTSKTTQPVTAMTQ